MSGPVGLPGRAERIAEANRPREGDFPGFGGAADVHPHTEVARILTDVEKMTDDANALRLVDRHADTTRRVSDMRAWWTWNGERWARDDDDRHIRGCARDLARELAEDDRAAASFKRNALSATGVSGAVRLAEVDHRVTVRAADLDAHPLLLNTRSGVVDLRTGDVRPHDAALLLTRIAPSAVELDAPTPRWDDFLKETFDGDAELASYVQRLAGLAVIGDVRHHVLPFLYGTGANGKGVMMLVWQGLLGVADVGGYAVSAPDGFLMSGRESKHETEIARLRGARLVVCSEQTGGKRFDEAKVKRLTGGDVLTGRFMRGNFFDFPPSHLAIVAGNHLPQVQEGGPSFWRRVRLVPFLHVVPEDRRDPELHSRLLAAEGPAILGWMVRGAMDVLAHGLADPDRVKAATEEYRVSEDTLASFVRDECLTGEHYSCEVGVLRSRYEDHCRQMGADALSARALTMRLTAEYGVRSGRLSRPQRRTYRGIGLYAAEGGPTS